MGALIVRNIPRGYYIIGLYFCVFIVLIFLMDAYQKRISNQTVEILVAARDIPKGVFLKPDMVVKSHIFVFQYDTNDVEDLQEVESLTTLVPIPKGRPIAYTQFSPSEKAQAPIRSHNPLNYTLAVDESTNTGKLYKPGANLYVFGKAGIKKDEIPIVDFPKVELVYPTPQPVKPFGYAKDNIHLISITPAQAEELKTKSGESIQLVLKGLNGNEMSAVIDLKGK